jgi:hypothetical protein
MPFNSIKIFENSSADLWNGLSFYKDEFGICDVWKPAFLNGTDSAAVSSNIPVLILSGELDPIAAAENGEIAKRTLPNAFLYNFQNTGHFVSYQPNAMKLVGKFLDNPTKEPDQVHFMKSVQIPFVNNVHVHSGVAALVPKLQLNSANTFYYVWIILVLVSFLVILFLILKEIVIRSRRDMLTRGTKFAYAAAALSAVLGICFFIAIGIIIFQTASENYYVLGFGLPEKYSAVLVLPYVIFCLLGFLMVISLLRKGRHILRDKYLLLGFLHIPFICFVLYFSLFY